MAIFFIVMKIEKPTLIIDSAKTKRNILAMANKAKENGLKFRPHFKTHQSKEIGEWFEEVGVKSITVSSLGMAKYFAQKGWQEITVAFPCNILQIELINELASLVKLILLVDNQEVIHKLNQQLSFPVEIYIEIDAGTHRTGVLWSDRAAISSIAAAVRAGKYTSLKGCYCHSGSSYASKDTAEIQEVYQSSMTRISDLQSWIGDQFGQLEYCYGDTPTCSIIQNFENVNAISPGNFTFYDIMQQQIGSCDFEQISVAMACPVVSLNKERKEVCIYGGAIHFSKDYILEDGYKVFGRLVELNADGTQWSSPIEECYIKSLSQEHGLVHMSQEKFDRINIGDILYFLPVHSCLTAECMGAYFTEEGVSLEHY